jgi:uncharacterized Zn-binding protein involved in type VI secretion
MANLASIRLAVNQHQSGVTGDRTSSLTRAANTPSAMGGVASNWSNNMSQAAGAFSQPVPNNPDGSPPSTAQSAVARGRQVQAFAGSVMGALSVPQDMLNVGFANLTAPIAAVFPSFPAATITMLYVGVPHAHSHPPSLIPPAPPVPLPSIGTILLGTSIKTLINGMPAARCGDIGLAVTCVGFFPFFQLKTGSSNTFIGGNRAARMLDICQVCSQADEPKTFDAGKIMGAIGAAARGAQKVMEYGGLAIGAMDIAASAAEAATEDDAAMASAKALAAAMAAAQMAADLATKALTKTMGKDPGIPPSSTGAVVLGHPNVLIGGFPMVNIPNPVDLILGRLARYKRKPPGPDNAGGQAGCPTCQGGK